MALEIVTLHLGPMDNNTYLIADGHSKQAVVIDPSFESQQVSEAAAEHGWQIVQIWLTHAHFDHIAGIAEIARSVQPQLTVALHPGDLPLWQEDGGAGMFGITVERGPAPAIKLAHGQILRLGSQELEVRHTPGHSPGHVVFYSAEAGTVFCGDLIFYRSVGRTDLPGGSFPALLQSIRNQIFTLPPETQLLSGHGPDTTVREEMTENPYLF